MHEKTGSAVRIRVIQQGKVVDETLVRHRRPVTVSTGLRNTVVIDDDRPPPSNRIMQKTRSGLRLRGMGWEAARRYERPWPERRCLERFSDGIGR